MSCYLSDIYWKVTSNADPNQGTTPICYGLLNSTATAFTWSWDGTTSSVDRSYLVETINAVALNPENGAMVPIVTQKHRFAFSLPALVMNYAATVTLGTSTTVTSPTSSAAPGSTVGNPAQPTNLSASHLSKHVLSGGAMAGISIGVLIGVALLVALGFLTWRHRKKRRPVDPVPETWDKAELSGHSAEKSKHLSEIGDAGVHELDGSSKPVETQGLSSPIEMAV